MLTSVKNLGWRTQPKAASLHFHPLSLSTVSAALVHLQVWVSDHCFTSPASATSCLFPICLTFYLFPFLFFVSPSIFLPALTITVCSITSGCSEPMGMKSRLVSNRQLTASSSFRTWGIEAFTWHPHYARLDKQGKTNAWTAATNNRSEWLQVGRDDMLNLTKHLFLVSLWLRL